MAAWVLFAKDILNEGFTNSFKILGGKDVQ